MIDEPELCLHPNAIRDACRVLYDLAERPGWQIMVTTHSPVFIDLSRDNTSIVRVERQAGGKVNGTTLFRPERSSLSNDDKENLKLLNIYDPYVAEFFFGGRIIVVEGDTEYSAFKYVANLKPDGLENLHIIRARGKVTIASLAKILNHFGASYSILHDADTPTIFVKDKKTGQPKPMTNSAWTNNQKILDAVNAAPSTAKIRLVASISNFETAYFGQALNSEKPYTAVQRLKDDGDHFKIVYDLLLALIDHNNPLPTGATAWSELQQLADALPQNEGA
jgi:putative ATP-dependent endonuclease of OLD family